MTLASGKGKGMLAVPLLTQWPLLRAPLRLMAKDEGIGGRDMNQVGKGGARVEAQGP